ncbi:CPBP family intramembrane glutamic endopeptidase [Halovivax limisalsi]|uniref:CPBP family intramembrane glutamic endopeptidase n=1 Tax=Halovivax limisalsi TaxID=1453760 RepID=UPI001FFC2B62|nr:CPBP family intramembrane glutamic endopeptidase [Halovivax limisalsi]
MASHQSGSTVQAPGGPVRAVVAAVSLAVFGILVSSVVTTPLILLDPLLANSPADASMASTTALLVFNFLGFIVAGAIYLWWTGRGWAWLDISWPTRRGWKYVGFGVVGAIGFYILLSVVTTVLGLSGSQNDVMRFIGDDPNMVLIMIGIVFLFNAPAEEFLFRNVVQKRLYASFDRLTAVVIASLVFAVIHVPSYALLSDGTVAPAGAIATSIASVFGGALIFGYLYAKSDNLLVPTIAHATFNAVQFGLLYLVLRYAPEELEAEPASVLELLAVLPW